MVARVLIGAFTVANVSSVVIQWLLRGGPRSIAIFSDPGFTARVWVAAGIFAAVGLGLVAYAARLALDHYGPFRDGQTNRVTGWFLGGSLQLLLAAALTLALLLAR